MIKGREIDDTIRNMGFEKGVVHCIREIAEAQMAANKEISELASTVLRLINTIDELANGVVGFRNDVAKMLNRNTFESEFDEDKKQ